MAQLDSSTPLLEMRGISKRFGATIALEGVDFSVDAGQVHALVGENGAGKSTLMKVLSGALQADSGTMHLAGKPYLPHNPLEARQLGVAMIYQELSLAPHLSVEENIVLGVEPTKKWPVRSKTNPAEGARCPRPVESPGYSSRSSGAVASCRTSADCRNCAFGGGWLPGFGFRRADQQPFPA